MFDHYYVPSSDTSDADWPEPLVVSLNALDSATLEDLPSYLCESIVLRHELGDIETHLEARPIVFEVGGITWLSERAVWSLLVELPNGADLVVEYVDRLIGFKSREHGLDFYSMLDVVGQDPLYAYFDRFLRTSWLESHTDEESLIKVIDSFGWFLRSCDMDHETFQHDYIGLALQFLKYRDSDRFLDLLVFRLSTGQQTELSPDQYDLLSGNGVLKALLDAFSAIDSGWSLHVDILRHCYKVYGSNAKLTEDVVEHYRERVNLGEENDLRNFQRGLTQIQERRDAIRDQWQRDLNTGFHRYDKNQKEWIKLI